MLWYGIGNGSPIIHVLANEIEFSFACLIIQLAFFRVETSAMLFIIFVIWFLFGPVRILKYCVVI